MRNFMLERMIDEIVQKGLLTESKGSIVKEIFEDFTFHIDLQGKKEFLDTLPQNSPSLDDLEKKIDEERKLVTDRFKKQKRGGALTEIHGQCFMFYFKTKELAPEEKRICKKIQLFILQNI